MEPTEKLHELFGKSSIKLVESGDHAILSVLRHVKSIGKSRVLIQDQGGWLTYKDYSKKAGLEPIELKTDYGIVDLSDLKEKADTKSVLLINSLNGYFCEQPMDKIAEICTGKKCLLVNDASGSIGTEMAKTGDIIIGSFGKNKPVNLHYGGFITFDEGEFEGEFDKEKLDLLSEELDRLFVRLQEWDKINKKIKEELKEFDIIHREKRGINVIVKFSDNEEKQKIINYCEKNNYEYTLCPRRIRVNTNAISIEVKRRNLT